MTKEEQLRLLVECYINMLKSFGFDERIIAAELHKQFSHRFERIAIMYYTGEFYDI